MKTNESIDDSRGSTDLSPVDTGAVIQGAASTPENKRRRLVRGAVAFAPLVLTLRSGALAAASCTGARLVDIPENGEFSPANTSEVCIEEPQICPGYERVSGPTKVLTHQSTPTHTVNPASGTNFYCGTSGSHISGKNGVAILSSMSACSLTGTCP